MSVVDPLHQHKLKTSTKRHKQQAQEDLLDLFPLPRYFQVHFQHIHERADTVHEELAELKVYVHKLEDKLDALLRLLAEHQQ